MATTETEATFADWLREQLEARGWGARTLARRIDPAKPEVPRRAINRYLHDGSMPTPEYVAKIAAALEVPAESLPVREAAPVAAPFRGSRARPATDVRPVGQEGAGGPVTSEEAA